MNRITLSIIFGVLACLPGAAQAQQFVPQLTQTVGSGSSESFLTVDFQDGTASHSYAFGYLYDGQKTGADLIAALSSGAGLGVTYLFNGGAVNSFSFDGHSQAGFANSGYWGYWLGADGQTWKLSGVGIKGRTLTNGSWDGWSWNANSSGLPPRTPAAVPEASPAASLGLLLGLGGTLISVRRKKRR